MPSSATTVLELRKDPRRLRDDDDDEYLDKISAHDFAHYLNTISNTALSI